MKLSTIQVPAGEDGDMERLAAGSAVELKGNPGKDPAVPADMSAGVTLQREFPHFSCAQPSNQPESLTHQMLPRKCFAYFIWVIH